jgi:hypothetical protein
MVDAAARIRTWLFAMGVLAVLRMLLKPRDAV